MKDLSSVHITTSRHEMIPVIHPSFPLREIIVVPLGPLDSFLPINWDHLNPSEIQGASCSWRRYLGRHENLPVLMLVCLSAQLYFPSGLGKTV